MSTSEQPVPARRVVLVPGVLALLPEYAGQTDPVAELRDAAVAAVAWAGPDAVVVAEPQGERVVAALRDAAGDRLEQGVGPAVVVVANGSAKRTEKAPGHLDERAVGFDEALGEALRAADVEHLRQWDGALARELMVGHPDGFARLAELLTDAHPARVDYADDPFGVQYWVMRWQCES
ncbi:hypothetical protein K8Z61_10675 [Nocardioides sp. TRM66260-LWL]|uniref:hypothetical protein n=1 Tax=Nocardioides sp. TRM66260-LWL TaxID=2874478 RepID=UPI001CC51998|nr:hypothetical protein [Nocardioides sp. TRM66260-LWL]MBZ5734961.1 hypothetical protein [Nocardioides sp. TRM66260-LWL]